MILALVTACGSQPPPWLEQNGTQALQRYFPGAHLARARFQLGSRRDVVAYKFTAPVPCTAIGCCARTRGSARSACDRFDGVRFAFDQHTHRLRLLSACNAFDLKEDCTDGYAQSFA